MVRLRRAVILVTLSVIALKRNLITNIERRKKVITVPKKPLFPILPYLGLLSLQTGTILRKSLKGIVNCPKLLIIYQSQYKLSNAFRFKDRILRELAPFKTHQKFQCVKQKQPSRGVPSKRCSENIRQICRRTPMLKCDFDKVAKQLF